MGLGFYPQYLPGECQIPLLTSLSGSVVICANCSRQLLSRGHKVKQMSKPKSAPSVPPPPSTLPSGMLDCDPDPTPAIFAELQAEHIQRAVDLFSTPPEVLRQRRERAEELEHERAKA